MKKLSLLFILFSFILIGCASEETSQQTAQNSEQTGGETGGKTENEPKTMWLDGNTKFRLVNGKLYAWGDNRNGKAGVGSDETTIYEPTKVNLENADNLKDIVINSNSVYAIMQDNTTYAWGYNQYGQLGVNVVLDDGSFATSINIPHKIEIANDEIIKEFIIGGSGIATAIYAITQNGNLYSWGYNMSGQLGIGQKQDKTGANITNQYLPEKVNLTNISKVYPGSNYAFVITTDGSLYAMGNKNSTYGILGLGELTENVLTPTEVNITHNGQKAKVSEIVISSNNSVYAITDLGLFAWGNNNTGQLGIGGTTSAKTPTYVNGITGQIDNITIKGNNSIFAKTSDGSLYAWGYNNTGQLGNADTASNVETPTQVVFEGSNAKFQEFVEIYGENQSSFMVALLDDGSLWAWGQNTYSRLGVGSDESTIFKPTQIIFPDNVKYSDIKEFVFNSNRTFAITNNGQVYAWGYNNNGQLGTGNEDKENQLSPVKIDIPGSVDNITASSNETFAIMQDGSLYSWGSNSNAQLGIEKREALTPEKVNIANVKSLLNVSSSIYAVTSDGSLYTWGTNNNGQLGLGEEGLPYVYLPKKVDIDDNIIDIKLSGTSSATANAFAISDTSIYSWGNSNNYGQIGIGNFLSPQQTPVKLDITGRVKETLFSTNNSVVLMEDGSMYAWGRNSNGAIGVGNVEVMSRPTLLQFN